MSVSIVGVTPFQVGLRRNQQNISLIGKTNVALILNL